MGELLTTEAADIAGVAPKTWSGYVARGQAPAPVRKVGRTPLWDEDEVRRWAGNRPGRGSRSTKRARERAAQRSQESTPEAEES